MVFTCQAGFEKLLTGELAGAAWSVAETGAGWVRVTEAGEGTEKFESLCFPHRIFPDAREVQGRGVNALAGRIAEAFFESARGDRFEAPWPLVFWAAPGAEGLGRRASAVRTEVVARLKKRMSRVARLARDEMNVTAGPARGLFAWFVDFERAFVAREIWCGGQRRMADDPQAPSRSYLKVEEAYGVLGEEPAEGQTVVDLGAAPGGWSYSAAKRGAQVVAIDNGPLKAGAAASERIEHRREDAFGFRPGEDEVFDWLFCDLVEEPNHVLRSIVELWVSAGWCRRFVINLKFGRADALALLEKTRATVAPHCEVLRIRHLFHDREEFTLVGRRSFAQKNR